MSRRIHDVDAPDYPYAGQRKRVLALKAKGICTVCGVAPAREGNNYCVACIERQKFSRNISRACTIIDGDCVQCGKPRGKGRKDVRLCVVCAGKQVAAGAVKRRRRFAALPCKRCGKVRGADYVYMHCAACHALGPLDSAVSQRERYKKLRADGICVRCGREPNKPGNARCHACAGLAAADSRQRYMRNIGRAR